MRTDNLRLAKVSKRLTAFLLLCLLIADIFPSSYKYVYAQSLVGGVEGQDSHSLNANRITPENMANLTLPLELGMIESVHPAANGNNRWVFLLQDAHSIPEAQISLQNLVQYFQKNYGVDLVALEGASGKVDTTLFRSFPDPQKLESVFAQYLDRGELSGGAVAAVLSPYKSGYYGVENTALYEKAIEAYLKSLPLRPIMKERVEKLGADLEALKKQHYSAELKSFDEKQSSFEENEDSLTAFLSVLAGYVPANKDKLPAFQKTYPHLAVILEEISQDESRKELLFEEARRVGNQISLALDQDDKKNFESKRHAFQSGEMPVEVYLGEMIDFSTQKNITVDFSDAAERQAKRYNAMRNMRGGELFDEIRAFSARIASHLAKTDEARSLIKLSEETGLLDRLTLTKLTRNDWDSLNAQKPTVNYPEPLREISVNIARLKQELVSDYPAYKFYQISCDRDAAITANLSALMEKNKNQSALLVTGGFHTSALGKMLAAKNISYAVVLPKLTDVPAQSTYEDHMKGKVSWQKFLKAKNGRVDIYDAFTRAASEQLLADSVERVADRKDFSSTLFAKRYTLKHWRDQLIRDLANEGRLSETYRYSASLDRLTWEGMNGSERKNVEKQWKQKLDGLVKVLTDHKNDKDWSGAKVMDLMGKATATPWTAIPFRRTNYPSHFLTVGDSSRAEVRMDSAVNLRLSAVDDKVKEKIENFYAETHDHYQRLAWQKGAEISAEKNQGYSQWEESYIYLKTASHGIYEIHRLAEKYNEKSKQLFGKIKSLPGSAFDYYGPKNRVTKRSLLARSEKINFRASKIDKKFGEIKTWAEQITSDSFPDNPEAWKVKSDRFYQSYLVDRKAFLENIVGVHAELLQLLTDLETLENDFISSPLSKKSGKPMVEPGVAVKIDSSRSELRVESFEPKDLLQIVRDTSKVIADKTRFSRGQFYETLTLKLLQEFDHFAFVGGDSSVTDEQYLWMIRHSPIAIGFALTKDTIVKLVQPGEIFSHLQNPMLLLLTTLERLLQSKPLHEPGVESPRSEVRKSVTEQDMKNILDANLQNLHPAVWNQIHSDGMNHPLPYPKLAESVNTWLQKAEVPGEPQFKDEIDWIILDSNQDFSQNEPMHYISTPVAEILYQHYFSSPRSEARSRINRADIKILMALKPADNRVLYRALMDMGYHRNNVQLEPRLENALQVFNESASEFDLVLLPTMPSEGGDKDKDKEKDKDKDKDKDKAFSRQIDEAWLGMSDTERPLLLRINTRENLETKATQLANFQLKGASERPITGGFGNRPIAMVWESLVERHLIQSKEVPEKQLLPSGDLIEKAIKTLLNFLDTQDRSEEVSYARVNLRQLLQLIESHEVVDERIKDVVIRTALDQKEVLTAPLVQRADAESDKPWSHNSKQAVEAMNAAFDVLHDYLIPPINLQAKQDQPMLSEQIIELAADIHRSLENFQTGLDDEDMDLFNALETIIGLETEPNSPELKRQKTIKESGILEHRAHLRNLASDGILFAQVDTVQKFLTLLSKISPRSEARAQGRKPDEIKIQVPIEIEFAAERAVEMIKTLDRLPAIVATSNGKEKSGEEAEDPREKLQNKFDELNERIKKAIEKFRNDGAIYLAEALRNFEAIERKETNKGIKEFYRGLIDQLNLSQVKISSRTTDQIEVVIKGLQPILIDASDAKKSSEEEQLAQALNELKQNKKIELLVKMNARQSAIEFTKKKDSLPETLNIYESEKLASVLSVFVRVLKPDTLTPKSSSRAKKQPAAKRSEVRSSKYIDYAALKGLKHVQNSTVISLQMEMGYSAGFLKTVEAKYGKKIADQVSQATLTGGLGALMHDLFPSWKANGLDIIGIHPIWEEIKKKPYPEGPLHLGQYQRQVMEDAMKTRGESLVTYTIDLNWDDDYKRYAQENEKAKAAFGRKVHIRALKEYTSQYDAPNYHLDAYYLIDEKKPDTEENRQRIFDTVYSDDHPAWRDYHLAVYARASEQLIKILKQKGEIKKNTVEIHNEVFVSMPKIEEDPNRTLVHINHSAYLPTIYSPNVKSYGLLGFPAWMRQYLVKDGNAISIVDFAALNYDLLTGVAIDEHYWVLRRNIFRNAGARLDHFNDGEIRSTNGVLTEHWQSPALQDLIEHYRALLGLPEKVDSVIFYKTLEANESLRAEFIARQELIKAAEVANFLGWMADIQKQPLWLEEALKESRKRREDFNAFFKAVEAAARSNDSKAWKKIKADYASLSDILLSHPMVSNARRQVPYKGPEKWLEVLYGLQGSTEKLAAFKNTKIRVVIGGRTFSTQADAEFQAMKAIVKELGLENHFAFIEDYNVFDAAIMFRAMAGVVMLSDEFLEASATSMMKGVVNSAALIGVWGGAMPELFKLIDENGQVIDIFKEKTPHNLVVKNLRDKKWKLVNGYLVRYSKEISHQAGGGRRPDAEALASSLFWLNEQYEDPVKRQELLWQSVSGTPKVDMREGQARAHMQLIEKLLTKKEHIQRDIFDAMTFKPEDFAKILNDETSAFVWRHHFGEDAIFKPGKESPRGLLGFVNMFREISTYGNGDARGKFALESVRHHALRGDLFQFMLYELRDAAPSLKPFVDEIKKLAAEAEPVPAALKRIESDPAKEDEYLVGLTHLTNLNVQALELIEKLGLWIAKQSFEMYLDHKDPNEMAKLNHDVFPNHFVKKYLSRYLDQNAEAVPLYTRDSLIRAYGILHQGQPYLFGINLGADPTFDKKRPQSKAYTDIPMSHSFQAFAEKFVPDYQKPAVNGESIYQTVNAINEEPYAFYDLKSPANVISLGVPSPEGIQLLKLKQHTGLAAQLLVAPRAQTFDTASLYKYLVNLQEKVREKKTPQEKLRGEQGKLIQAKIDEEMLEFADIRADIARSRFGKYLPRIMGLVAVLSPKYLDKIKDWDEMVYASLKKVISRNTELFEKGTLTVHVTSRKEQTVVISRVIEEKNNFSDQNIIFALEFSEEPVNQDDGKVGSRVLELAPISLVPTDEYDVVNLLSGTTYQAVRTGTELMDGWTIRVPVRDFYERGEKVRHGWGIDIYKIRSVTPRFDLTSETPELPEIATPNLILGLNLLDLAATYDNTTATVTVNGGLKKLDESVGTIQKAGFGSVYTYGGLFASGEISKKLHAVDANGLHWIGDTADESLPRVLVSVNGYDTKKDGNLRDNHGNAFSVNNLIDIDSRHAATDKEAEALIRKVTAQTASIFDFVFWRSPESVNNSNYKQYFYRELTLNEKEDWDEAQTDADRLKVMKNLTRAGGHFAVRISENGQERLILVQHMFDEPGRDQAVRNPFNPAVIAQSKKEIELAIDRGARGIRIDLAHKLLNSELKKMMDAWQALGWQTDPAGAYRADFEPLQDLIAHAKQYAKSNKREFYVIGEAYMQYHHDALRNLGIDAVYYENPQKDYAQLAAGSNGINARHLGEALQTAVRDGDLFVFPSNYDGLPLKNSQGSREAFLLALVILARKGVKVMLDARELMDQHGQLIPIPGKNHPFPTPDEIQKRRDFKHFMWQFEQSPFVETIREFLHLINGRNITELRILDNENRDQFITIDLVFTEGKGRSAKKDHLIVILNMKPSEDKVIWSEGASEKDQREMIDLQTGERFSVGEGKIKGIVFPSNVQYRILKPASDAPSQKRSEVRVELVTSNADNILQNLPRAVKGLSEKAKNDAKTLNNGNLYQDGPAVLEALLGEAKQKIQTTHGQARNDLFEVILYFVTSLRYLYIHNDPGMDDETTIVRLKNIAFDYIRYDIDSNNPTLLRNAVNDLRVYFTHFKKGKLISLLQYFTLLGGTLDKPTRETIIDTTHYLLHAQAKYYYDFNLASNFLQPYAKRMVGYKDLQSIQPDDNDRDLYLLSFTLWGYFYLLGNVEKDYEEALSLTQKVFSYDPNEYGLLPYYFAKRAAGQSQLNEADIKLLKKSNKQLLAFWLNYSQGVSALLKSDLNNARKFFGHYEDFAFKNPFVFLGTGLDYVSYLLKSGQKDKARKTLFKMLAVHEDDGHILISAPMVFFKMQWNVLSKNQQNEIRDFVNEILFDPNLWSNDLTAFRMLVDFKMGIISHEQSRTTEQHQVMDHFYNWLKTKKDDDAVKWVPDFIILIETYRKYAGFRADIILLDFIRRAEIDKLPKVEEALKTRLTDAAKKTLESTDDLNSYTSLHILGEKTEQVFGQEITSLTQNILSAVFILSDYDPNGMIKYYEESVRFQYPRIPRYMLTEIANISWMYLTQLQNSNPEISQKVKANIKKWFERDVPSQKKLWQDMQVSFQTLGFFSIMGRLSFWVGFRDQSKVFYNKYLFEMLPKLLLKAGSPAQRILFWNFFAQDFAIYTHILLGELKGDISKSEFTEHIKSWAGYQKEIYALHKDYPEAFESMTKGYAWIDYPVAYAMMQNDDMHQTMKSFVRDAVDYNPDDVGEYAQQLADYANLLQDEEVFSYFATMFAKDLDTEAIPNGKIISGMMVLAKLGYLDRESSPEASEAVFKQAVEWLARTDSADLTSDEPLAKELVESLIKIYKGEHAEAVTELEKLRQNASPGDHINFEIDLYLALAYDAMGQKEKAKGVLRQGLKDFQKKKEDLLQKKKDLLRLSSQFELLWIYGIPRTMRQTLVGLYQDILTHDISLPTGIEREITSLMDILDPEYAPGMIRDVVNKRFDGENPMSKEALISVAETLAELKYEQYENFRMIELISNKLQGMPMESWSNPQERKNKLKLIAKYKDDLKNSFGPKQYLNMAQDLLERGEYGPAYEAVRAGVNKLKNAPDEDLSKKLKKLEGDAAAAQKALKDAEEYYKSRRFQEAKASAEQVLHPYNPRDRAALRIQNNVQVIEDAIEWIRKGHINRAVLEFDSALDLTKDETLKAIKRIVTKFAEELQQIPGLLEEKDTNTAAQRFETLLEQLKSDLQIDQIEPEFPSDLDVLQRKIQDSKDEIKTLMASVKSARSIKDVYRDAHELANYKGQLNQVTEVLLSRSAEAFNDASKQQFNGTASSARSLRENAFKRAYNFSRIILELAATHADINSQHRLKAREIISQSGAVIWYPDLLDSYFMISAFAKAEKKRDEREEKNRPTPLFQYKSLVFENGIKALGFSERIEQFARPGDTFQIVVQLEDKPLPVTLTVVEAGYDRSKNTNFVRFEMPKVNGDETLLRLIQDQIGKTGFLKRVRTMILQKKAEMLEGMLDRLKENISDKIDPGAPSRKVVTTGSKMADTILGLRLDDWTPGLIESLNEQKGHVATAVKLLEEREKRNLDPSQREGIIHGVPSMVDFVIYQGPGGTGKTTAALWLIKLLLEQNKRIAVYAHANRAIDNVLIRALDDKELTPYLARLGNTGLGTVHPKVMPLWNEKEIKGDSGLLAKLARSNKRVLSGTIDGMNSDLKLQEYPSLKDADVTIVDEGSVVTLVDALWTAVAFHGVKKLVLLGDQAQLPAYFIREEEVKFIAEELGGREGLNYRFSARFGNRPLKEIFSTDKLEHLRTSLMERIVTMFYPKGAESPDDLFPNTRPPFFFFDGQRRAGKRIVELANYFYDGRLKPMKPEPGEVKEVDTKGLYREMTNVDENSTYNPGEADIVLSEINRLINESKMPPKEIAVITPYKGQVRYIQNALHDLALIHEYLRQVERGEKPRIPPMEFRNAVNSEAVMLRLREKLYRDTKDKDQRFAQKSAQEQNKILDNIIKTQILPKLSRIETGSIPQAKTLRNNLELGESFVPLDMLQKGEFNILTVDSSIGSEFEATILSFVRSNDNGTVGFLAGEEGKKRRNVAQTRAGGKTPGKLIFLWHADHFKRSKDQEVKEWANFMSNKFEEFRDEDRKTASRAEVRVKKPEDLHTQARNFLTRFALREGHLFIQDAERLGQVLRDFGVEQVAYAIREEGVKPVYSQIFSGASVYADYRTETGFLNAHPDYSEKLAARIDLTLEKIRAGSHAYLQTNVNHKLSFAYAYHIGSNASVALRSNLLSNIRLVKALREEYPSRVKGSFRILMPSFLAESENFAPFIKEIESSGVAKILWTDQAGASSSLERYLVENPNALVYGRFDSYLVSEKMAYRYMDSKVSLEAAFPVTLTVTAGLAATPKIEAEELRKTLPDLLPGVIRFNGSSFEITSAALELVYHEHQVAQLLARMA